MINVNELFGEEIQEGFDPLGLGEIAYGPLSDGNYEVTIKEITPVRDYKNPEQSYLNVVLILENGRQIENRVYPKGIPFLVTNLKNFLSLGEVTRQEVLNAAVGKVVPAVHETVRDLTKGKTYWNWHIARTNSNSNSNSDIATGLDPATDLEGF